MSDNSFKTCNRCGKSFPATAEYFYRCKSHKDGLHNHCKTCDNAGRKQWRKDNPEKFKAQLKRNLERHPDKPRIHTARHRERNHEKVLERTRKWRAKKKDRVQKYNLKYRSEKSDTCRAARLNRRALLEELPNDFTDQDWQYALEYFNGCCAICKRPLNGLWHRPAADHWIPLSKGGGTTRDNIVPLCDGVDGCNQSKSNLDPTEWLTRRYGTRRANKILAEIAAYFSAIIT